MLEKSPDNNTLLWTFLPQIRQPFDRHFFAPLLDHAARDQGHHFLQARGVDEGELFGKVAALKVELFRSVHVLYLQPLVGGPRGWVREVNIIWKQHFLLEFVTIRLEPQQSAGGILARFYCIPDTG
uniref:Uncharacterized protein n=1 Tax=Anopheles albimanus TaxID=7167 RepID=A0A182FWH6_ANOAL